MISLVVNIALSMLQAVRRQGAVVMSCRQKYMTSDDDWKKSAACLFAQKSSAVAGEQ